ncbi:glycosidase [Thiococcus pfennigii]|uniref:glycosidase n=1 Tax=Thiococcus pfennigii TaxID=1057 RepID=UPI001903A066|nr:glycosidase [Thiococcus pfennigii]MBK1701073.1 glycosidase [Thiococcus pfennigii]MBK1733051.1 glycosidase [Thiococcus pfennigii]
MPSEAQPIQQALPNGVMLNAYPDSIGGKLSDIVELLKKPELEGAFSLFYILPTFFNSDLDRGFSIVDYDHNEEFVSRKDLDDLRTLDIGFKFDLILNHLSVRSPQFQDLLQHGDGSRYKDFFVDWNEFWAGHGVMGPEGYVIPKQEFLQKLFMRKPGLPVLKVRFPDGSERPYWNTFYQEINCRPISPADLLEIPGLTPEGAEILAEIVNEAIESQTDVREVDLSEFAEHREVVVSLVERNREYLGQMDLNARSDLVWSFYEETLRKLRDYGARIVRLDAFAYLHKAPGEVNFFNRPGTWEYLERLKEIARRHDLIIFPEIHAEYGSGLHEEVAQKGFPIYDFFFPGLVIDALERGSGQHLRAWAHEIGAKGIQTINMLGCHDGIPVLDLRGKQGDAGLRPGLLPDEQIDEVMQRIVERGGRIKNLFGPDGRKISYYQVNATFFSALGEDERKLRLARAIQLFMPGIPQVWYLDLFAGTNNYAAADLGGAGGHKEINRTNLSPAEVEAGLTRPIVRDQLALIRLRNNSPAFAGDLELGEGPEHTLEMTWRHDGHRARLWADLREHSFTVSHTGEGDDEVVWEYR